MAEDRLDRIEKNIERLTIENLKLETMIKRMGKYAMVIARVHDDELHHHTRRLIALEEEMLNGDDAKG